MNRNAGNRLSHVPAVENLRIRVPEQLKDLFEAACARKKVSQQQAVVSLMEWFVAQPGMLQSLVLGHFDHTPEERKRVAQLALEMLRDGELPTPRFDAVLDVRNEPGARKRDRSRARAG